MWEFWRTAARILSLLACLLALELRPPDRGFWDRSYLANLPMPTTAAWTGESRLVPDAASTDPEGIGAYLGTELPNEELPGAERALRDLSLGWARSEIPWAGVEPQRGVHTWGTWDRSVDTLRAHHYRVLGMLCYWVHWTQPYSDQGIAEFGRYCEEVARRYRGRVEAWEVWNEPNSPDFWRSTPERYVALLQAAYEGVKRGDPDARVIGGSLSGVDLVYLRRILAAGAGRWMDALSVHAYTFGWTPEDSQFADELKGASHVMAGAGKDPGIWVTELGFNTGDRKQEQWLERTVVLLRQSGVVRRVFWFCLQIPRLGYSLYRPDGRPRPAGSRYARLAAELRGCRALGSCLPADRIPPYCAGNPYALSPMQSWAFAGDDGVRRVTWCPGGTVTGAPTAGDAPLTSQPVWERPARLRP